MNEMKKATNIKAELDCTRFLERYRGVTAKNGKEREYDIVSTRCRVYRGPDGAIVDPGTAGATREFYGVVFTRTVWNAIADTASVLDTVTLEGDLMIPERGEKGFYEGTRSDGSKFESGDLVNAKPVGFVPGPFKGGKLPKADDLEPHVKDGIEAPEEN